MNSRILYIEVVNSGHSLKDHEILGPISGSSVVRCTDLKRCTEQLKDGKFDLVIAEALPSGEGSIEMFRSVRKLIPEVPFIFLASEFDNDLAEVFFNEGGTDCVPHKTAGKIPYLIQRVFKERKAEAEKVLAEAQLAENKYFVQSVFNAVGSHIVVVDNQGLILSSNSAWNHFQKRLEHRKDVNRENFWSVMEAFDVDKASMNELRAGFEQACIGIDHNVMLDYPLELDGTIVWYAVRMNVFSDKDWVVITQTNISVRKDAEEQLRENEERYRSLFENMTQGLIMVSPEGNIVMANPSFMKMTGYSREELLGSGLQLLPNEDAVYKFRQRLEDRKSGKSEKYEVRILTKSGKLKWVKINASPRFSSDGTFLGTMSLVDDITLRKSLEISREISLQIAQKANEVGVGLKDFFRFVQNALGRFMYTENFLVAVKREDRDTEFLFVKDEFIGKDPFIRSNGNGLAEYVFTSGNPVLINTQEEFQHFVKENDFDCYGHNCTGWMGAPFMIKGKLKGVIACKSYDLENCFSQDQLELLALVGQQVGIFIERYNATEEKERILNLSKDLICIINEAGFLKYANPAFTNVLGYTLEELMAARLIEFTHPDDRKTSYKAVQDLNSGKINSAFVNRFFSKDGQLKYLSWVATPAKEEGAYYAIARDITEEVRFREQIEESERKYRGLFEHMNEGLLYSDREGKILVVNPGFCKMLGYEAEELIGHIGYDMICETDTATELRKKVEYRERGESEVYQTQLKKKNGEKIWVMISSAPAYTSDGTFYGIMSIITNITAEKRAELEAAELKEAFTRELEEKVIERTRELDEARLELAISLEKEKELGELKSRFVSTASHQFRTPLAVIQNSIAIMAMQKEGMSEEFKSRFENIYDRIRVQINRMTNLMDDILILGKINSGNVNPTMEEVDLVDICGQQIAYYSILEPEKRLELQIHGDVRRIYLDPGMMENVVSNLLSNALKYSADGTLTRLSLAYTNDKVMMEFRDEGIGIPDKDIDHLFDPFFRASNALDLPGTGLGTSIIKEYVTLMGGDIQVRSKVGKGTVFTITFSLKEPDSQSININMNPNRESRA